MRLKEPSLSAIAPASSKARSHPCMGHVPHLPWQTIVDSFGGFDEAFTGYGGEDTDFAWNLREHGIDLLWVGGAHAYHQWHPVSSPPWEHLDDILRNAARFRDKWGEWPMQGWLDAFEEQGAIALIDGTYQRTTP